MLKPLYDAAFPAELKLSRPPQRVVSLVPSMTESLFALGLGGAVVGVTDYCTQPPQAVANLPRLGGPKDPRVADILALQPDLVLANREENPREIIEFLQAYGLQVWVTFPRTVSQSIEVLWSLVNIFRNRDAVLRLELFSRSLDWMISSLAERAPWRYFCPIWQEGQLPSWWMTFNQDTYASDLLRLMGGENVFAGRQRLYPLEADLGQAMPEPPGERDTRYPHVALADVIAADPEVIILPSEPFAFTPAHRQALQLLFAETGEMLSRAVRQDRIYLVDGSLITWHGVRLAQALSELPNIIIT